MTDPCQPSIEILRRRCTQWFRKKGIRGRLHFPDCDGSLFQDSGDETVHVVFFGSFLKRFLESANWTPRRYRFWVLCEAAKEVMTGLLDVPAANIEVIPRYELYPAARIQREFPAPGEPFTLVFAGRISPSKNIETLLEAVSCLQTELLVPVRLVLFGRFDEEPSLRDYRMRIRKLLKTLPFADRPRLIEGLGPAEWQRRRFEKAVLVSFSTFLSEDFGVSVAQAQARGWPCLLSDWGAHRDVRGPGVRLLPASLIAAGKGKELALLIAGQLGRSSLSPGLPPRRAVARPPAVLTVERLDSIRRGVVRKLGQGARLICDGDTHLFHATPTGGRFFARYRELMRPSAARAGMAWIQKMRRLTVAPPKAPATKTQLRKKIFAARPTGSSARSPQTRPAARKPL
jgi:hypothetical protein